MLKMVIFVRRRSLFLWITLTDIGRHHCSGDGRASREKDTGDGKDDEYSAGNGDCDVKRGVTIKVVHAENHVLVQNVRLSNVFTQQGRVSNLVPSAQTSHITGAPRDLLPAVCRITDNSLHRCPLYPASQTPLTSRHAPVSSKHSVEGMGRQGMVDACRFHPYQRQLSEGALTNAVCLEAGSSPFRSLQEICSPQMCCITLGPNSEAQTLWEQSTYNGQVATWPYATEAHSNKPNYSLQSLSSQIHQMNNSQPLFPKPIYSYSILIFMALKNSETGSLPVSEIYSFMTENFPYFKTAPDGWKNSVRHNLSLNKCFEKLEGKNGNSSRKGCLWGLNPAKVEKMQEELHKWRRKDPVSVRRSMARPEDLDHLIGQMPKKLQSTAPYARHASFSRQPPSRASRHPQYSRAPPASQQSSFLSFTDNHFSDSMTLHSPCDEQHAADVHPGSVNLIATGRLPPAYSATYQDAFNVGLRSLQDLQLEGDTYDVDVLNPSLTDLQLKGNLWEELQKDSLMSHLQTTPTTVSITSGLQASCVHPGCVDGILPVSETSAVVPFGGCKIEFDDTSSEPSLKRDCSSRWHPDVYSADNLPAYLTCCTTSLV